MKDRGWEYRKISEFAQEIYVGAMPKLSERKTGNFPTIQLKDIITLKSPFLYECKTMLDISNIKNKRTASYGDILIVYSSGKKVVGRVFVYLGNKECMIGEGICVIKHLQNPKYLLHVLNSPHIQRQIQWATQKQSAIGGLRSCSVSDLKNISIPLPSLTEQEQIANYLDDLLLSELQLSDSLEKILEIRKKQYEYYKEQILTSEIDKWDIKTIEEIAIEIYCGDKVTKEQLGTGDWPAIKCGDINSKLKICFKECVSFINPNLVKRKKYFEYGDLLVSGVGSDQKTAGLTATYLGKQPGILGGMVYVVRHKQNPQFLAYMMSSRFCRKQIELRSCGGSVFNFFMKDLKKIQVPLPPLEQQEQIVSILEKIDTQITKLNKNIQELTSARQQQCQYLTSQTIN